MQLCLIDTTSQNKLMKWRRVTVTNSFGHSDCSHIGAVPDYRRLVSAVIQANYGKLFYGLKGE